MSLFKSIKICGNEATKTSLLSALVMQMTPNRLEYSLSHCDIICPITYISCYYSSSVPLECMCFSSCSLCDLIGRLPIALHGEGAVQLDQVQLHFLVSAHLTMLRAGLMEPLLQALVRPRLRLRPAAHSTWAYHFAPLLLVQGSSPKRGVHHPASLSNFYLIWS